MSFSQMAGLIDVAFTLKRQVSGLETNFQKPAAGAQRDPYEDLKRIYGNK